MPVHTSFGNSRDDLLSSSPLPLPEYFQGCGFPLCMTVIANLVKDARERVRRNAEGLVAAYPNVPFEPTRVEEILAGNLVTSLLKVLAQVMILELNVARLEEVLEGDTPEERFVSFLYRLQEPEIANQLLSEYPVMVAQIKNCLEKWCTGSSEFLRHLCEDWEALRAAFFVLHPGKLVKIQGGAGDLHRGGRSVTILAFTDGSRLVYKPRSLAVDEHFQQLLAWLNERGAEPQFRVFKSFDRVDHGWAEFIAPGSCATPQEVSRFYRRQGNYLAILYALEGSDFHAENLIAAGEHPMLIDLEALFHPRFETASATRVEEVAGSALSCSVLRVGLLPARVGGDKEHKEVDMSGLGNRAGQLSARKMATWERIDTDEMHLVRKRIQMQGTDNCPTLHDATVHALDYTEPILTGFISMYRLLINHRTELLGVLKRFAQDEVRAIARATQTYGTLLDESFHPDLLRDEADRRAHFDRLQEATLTRSALQRLVSIEREDLWRGDIPFFTTRPSSRDLWTSTGERLQNYFPAASLTVAEERILQLSEKDLERQLWILRASLATLSSKAEGPGQRIKSGASSADSEVRPEQLISAACNIGDRLKELAVWANDGSTWLGLLLVREDEWRLSPLGFDLYDGLPGVIFFLAYLGAVSGDHSYWDLAKAALRTLRRQIEELGNAGGIGAFTGWGGVLYLLAHLGVIWADASLLAEAEALLERLPASVEQDKVLDIIGGAAGCILVLRALHKSKPSPKAIEIARICGERLLQTAQPAKAGAGWLCSSNATSMLTGFAHGAAGIAMALLALAELTGNAAFKRTALSAFDYERSLFSPEQGNWPDLRENGSGFAVAWCHGAPGIGLSRLYAIRRVRDPLMNAEIEAALSHTLHYGFGSNHTLCHGDLGNADILLRAALVLRKSSWQQHANKAAAAVIRSARETGWICGNPLGVESPGLMTGLAGAGYAFLRLADPGHMPSVLALDPPVLL